MSNDTDDTWLVHIYAPEQEEETVHASVKVDQNEGDTVPSRTGDSRVLVLNEGGLSAEDLDNDVPDEDNPYTLRSTDDPPMAMTLTHRHEFAIGYYLHLLEIHDLNEEVCHNGVYQRGEETGLPVDEFYTWAGRMSAHDRRMRLLDLAEWRVDDGGDWATEPYLHECSWRSTDLSESGKDFGARVRRHLDPNPQQCYRNAQEAAIQHAENHRVQYVEGLALHKQAAQVSRHAWIEYEDEVVEVTWPWHDIDGGRAVYFGTPFDAETVEEAFDRRNGGSPLILDDDDAARLNEVRQR